jgi:membrane-bound ClpP family serine protease
LSSSFTLKYWKGKQMIILGIVLILVAVLAGIAILKTLGVILLVVGAVLFLLGSMGRPMGGRRHYW